LVVWPDGLVMQLGRPLATINAGKSPLENPLAVSHWCHNTGNKAALIHTSPHRQVLESIGVRLRGLVSG
jgi:hypothetical protein